MSVSPCITAVYEAVEDKKTFMTAYSAAYTPTKDILYECYEVGPALRTSHFALRTMTFDLVLIV
jgi:hypothetical protein